MQRSDRCPPGNPAAGIRILGDGACNADAQRCNHRRHNERAGENARSDLGVGLHAVVIQDDTALVKSIQAAGRQSLEKATRAANPRAPEKYDGAKLRQLNAERGVGTR
jgi:hypothetical protein